MGTEQVSTTEKKEQELLPGGISNKPTTIEKQMELGEQMMTSTQRELSKGRASAHLEALEAQIEDPSAFAENIEDAKKMWERWATDAAAKAFNVSPEKVSGEEVYELKMKDSDYAYSGKAKIKRGLLGRESLEYFFKSPEGQVRDSLAGSRRDREFAILSFNRAKAAAKILEQQVAVEEAAHKIRDELREQIREAAKEEKSSTEM